jgi:esterase/lipase superfamily enzyme
MGNRVLAEALRSFDASRLPEGSARLRQIVFAAPDIDADTFRGLAEHFYDDAERLTLYASCNDKALQVSKGLHGYPRAGDCADIVVLEGLDTIDASSVDTDFLGHSYFGDNRSLLSDLYWLIKQGNPPTDRFGMKRLMKEDIPYWLFRP